MKFTQTHAVGSDETAPFDVSEYEAKNVGEFVNEVLKSHPNEWGTISVRSKYFRVEYRHGKLVKPTTIPKNIASTRISEVKAAGGWSNMDYIIF